MTSLTRLFRLFIHWGTYAVPAGRFEQPRVTLNGTPATGKIHVKEGRSQLELTGIFNPKP